MSARPEDAMSAGLRQLEATVVRESVDSLQLGWGEDERGWKPQGRASTLHLNPANWTSTHFDAVRNDSRHLCLHNEFAIGGLECRQDYIVGDGFAYAVEPLPGVDANGPAVRAAAEFVDSFVELNALHEVEAESLLRADRDGEFFLRLFPAAGIPEARWVEPDEVFTPPEMDERKYIRHGVEFAQRANGKVDCQTVVAYHIAGEQVPEAEVVHAKFNSDSSVARGVPTLYPVDSGLRRCADLLRGMSSTAKVRAKIALLWRLKQISQRTEDDLQKRLRHGSQVDASGERRPVNVEELPFGSIIRYREGEQLDMPAANVGASDTVQVLQAELRAVGTRVRMPEWMFTGLADQKYSNAFVVEAPTLKAFRRVQRRLTEAFGAGRMRQRASLVWRAVRMAVRMGLLPPAVLSSVRVVVTPPALEVRDKVGEANVNRSYVEIGVKSIPTVQKELGLDPETEKKNGAKPMQVQGGTALPGGGGDPGAGLGSPGS